MPNFPYESLINIKSIFFNETTLRLPRMEKISPCILNALMEYINKCGDMGRIKQNNYANYIALKSIFLNLHKKKELPATFGRQLLVMTNWGD